MPREEIISGDTENIVGALTNAFGNAVMQMRSGLPAGGWRAGMPAPAAAGRTVTGPLFAASQIANQVGSGQQSKLRAPLGLGFHTFTALGTFKFVVEPQEAFRGERLVLEVLKDGAAGVGVMVNSITVGSLAQQPSTELGSPSSMFRPDATGAEMEWQICPAGTKIIVEVEAVGGAFAEGDTVTVEAGIYGEWVRG